MKACSFFGHRDTPQTDELKQQVRETVEGLIVEEGVDTFLFGSRSNFDELCHIVVSELKEKYPYIRRIAYLCKHETACLVGAGTSLTKRIKDITGRDELVLEYEEIEKPDRVMSAGKAAYLERNQEMIDISDFCVFYYNPNYHPTQRKSSRKSLCDYQSKSGTRIAFEYAYKKNNGQKGGKVINVYKKDECEF